MIKGKKKEKEEIVNDVISEVEVMSEAKAEFLALIEKYREQNPTKFASKEKYFLAKLKKL